MGAVKSNRTKLIKIFLLTMGSVLLGMLSATSMQLQIRTEEKIKTITIESGKIELSETEVPVVEEVDGGKIDVSAFASQGEFYRTDTFYNFITDTENKCVVEGNVYGAQCVSLAQAFWTNYAGRGISDCGTGAARGIWSCREYNAGEDFEIVESSQSLQPGDWLVFDSGMYGHIGMVYEAFEGNYIPLYGENQGGKPCEAGGSQPNYIKISNKTLLGAFRPKSYIKVEPVPTPDSGALK